MKATTTKFEIGQEVLVVFGTFLGQVGTVIDVKDSDNYGAFYRVQFDWGKNGKPIESVLERHLRLYS